MFCICDEYVINLFVCIYKVRKGTKNYLALVLKLCYTTMIYYERG